MNHNLRFGPFEVNRRTGELLKDGRRIKLQDQPFAVLVALLEHPGEMVTRDELRQKLWPADTFVGFDDGLNTAVKRLRDALGDTAESPRFIETLPRRGYRFIGALDEATSARLAGPLESAEPTGVFTPPLHPWRLTTGVAIGASVAALMLIAFLATRHATPPQATHQMSIAVVPLDNLSGDPTQDAFADAMTEELITDLAKVSSLQVISRGSVVALKATHKSPPEIGRALHVDTIVEGSVVRSGDHVRITAQLVDVATDHHLWAESYDRDLRDVLTLQKEVAGVIARNIRATLTPGEEAHLAAPQPTNPNAYLAYIKGRSAWNQRTEPALRAGIESFHAAIEADPLYAEAYAGIADCYTALGYGSYMLPKTAFENARVAAEKSIDLNPDVADAHASLAYVKLYYDWDFAGAETEFQRALSLNARSVTAHDWYSVYLTAMGRFDEAEKEIVRAQALDPLAASINTDAGFVSYYSGHYDAAARQLRATLDMAPTFPLAHLWLGRTYQEQQHLEDANREYAAAAAVVGDWPVTMAAIGNVDGLSGDRPAAQQVLKRLNALSSQKYVTPYGVGLVYAAMGDDEQAFAALQQAVVERSNWLVWLKLDPRWGRLRRDARFAELLRQVGLTR